MFIKDKTKVACRMSGFSEELSILESCCLRPIINEKFGLRRVKSKKVSRHSGGNELQSGLEVGDT